MERLTYGALVYYQFVSLRAPGLKHGIFTRLGGVSQGIYQSLNLSRSTGDAAETVAENRRRMFEAMDMRQARSVTSWLVHSNTVRVIGEADLGQNDVHADAMVTAVPGLPLTLRFADCVPVLFHDPARRAIGIAHAGWLGIERGVLPATVQAMRQAFGCQPRHIRAGIGPSIGPGRFEVGADVAARIQAAVPDPVILPPSGEGNPHIDLWQAAESQLRACGLADIETAGLCTASDTREWFSHRAEHGRTGRFGAIVELAG